LLVLWKRKIPAHFLLNSSTPTDFLGKLDCCVKLWNWASGTVKTVASLSDYHFHMPGSMTSAGLVNSLTSPAPHNPAKLPSLPQIPGAIRLHLWKYSSLLPLFLKPKTNDPSDSRSPSLA